jgi:septal ring factor EnvC (AmiA/AmiB activator)
MATASEGFANFLNHLAETAPEQYINWYKAFKEQAAIYEKFTISLPTNKTAPTESQIKSTQEKSGILLPTVNAEPTESQTRSNQEKYPQLKKKITKLTGFLNAIADELQTKDYKLSEIKTLLDKLEKIRIKIRTEFDTVLNEIKKQCEAELTIEDVEKLKENKFQDLKRKINTLLQSSSIAEIDCGKHTDMAARLTKYYEEKGMFVTPRLDNAGDTRLTLTIK